MKSETVEKINKLIWTNEIKNYKFIIEHRGALNDEKTISGEDVSELKERFLILKDGSKIPIHRIKRVTQK